jgi:hypothetical protein
MIKLFSLFVLSSLVVMGQSNWEQLNAPVGEGRFLYTASRGEPIYNTSAGLFRSFDGGITWSQFFNTCEYFIWKDNIYLIMKEISYPTSNFYVSTDYGDSWTTTGSTDWETTTMGFSRISNNVYAGFYKYEWPGPPQAKITYSSDYGFNWITQRGGIYFDLNVLPGDTLYASVSAITIGIIYLGFMRSTDQGYTWSEVNTGLPELSIGLTHDKNYDLYTHTENGIYKFDKSNDLWELFSTSLTNNVSLITFNRSNHIIAIQNGKLYASVYGQRWYRFSEGIDNEALILFTSDSSGYYYTVDHTSTMFKSVTPFLINQLPTSPELISPINNQQVGADTVNFIWNSASPLVMNYSVNISTDSLFTTFIDTLVTDTSATLFDLTVNQKYFWRVNALNEVGWGSFSNTGSFITGITNVKIDPDVKLQFAIWQNFPNPFNPVTKIKYQTPELSLVTLKIYDVLGREVATLVNEEQTAGRYEIEFNGTGLPSGIYFFRLRVGEFIETKKMILQK